MNASLYHELNLTAGYALIVVVLTIILTTALFAPSFSHTHGEILKELGPGALMSKIHLKSLILEGWNLLGIHWRQ